MAKSAKRPRMTQRDKRERAMIKKELQEKGIIPPDKKPLNRKKFVEEATAEWDAKEKDIIWDIYLNCAMSWMLTSRERSGKRLSAEAVGVAKMLKIAIKLQEMHQLHKEAGAVTTIGDEYDVAKQIMDL